MYDNVGHDAELHKWSMHTTSVGEVFYRGYIFNDKKGRFGDGTYVRTSLAKLPENGKARTLNTVYKLVGEEVSTYRAEGV